MMDVWWLVSVMNMMCLPKQVKYMAGVLEGLLPAHVRGGSGICSDER
jgi:hypothetical protein